MLSAIPADPAPRKVRQPDGTTLTIIVRGDERGSMAYTADGVPLFQNPLSGAFEYARLSGDSIVGSGITAADAGKRDANSLAYIKQLDMEAIGKALTKKRTSDKGPFRIAPSRIRINDFPTTGNQKCLVILMDFPDMEFSVEAPQQFFTNMLNEEGFTYSNGANGSVRDFFLASSYGKFDPEFDVVGPVRLSQPYAYYGGNTNGTDWNFSAAIVEACEAIDDEVDFSQYDADGDGFVDNIYFYYAGYGEADTQNANYIWPHSFYLWQGWHVNLTLDGVQVDRYSCGNELRGGTTRITGIGTFVHEFGHVLGLADHYPTDNYALAYQVDPGEWDTMASGSYNNDMNTPPLYSAFERAELGWLDYIDIDTSVDTICSLPNLGDSNKAYRVKVPDNDNEYYIMENRQQKGWDTYLPGHGMLLWHIDMDESVWTANTVNNDVSHQRVDIVEADGLTGPSTYSGDPFPGTSAVSSVSLTSWKKKSLMSVYDIVEEDDTIRMALRGADYKYPAPEGLTATEIADNYFTLAWTPVDDGRTYWLSVQKDDGKGNLEFLPAYNNLSIGSASTFTVTGVEPSTTYKVTLIGAASGFQSYPATVFVTTEKLSFANSKPAGLAVANATATGFTATWDEMEAADDYLVTLFKHNYASQSMILGYDFENRGDGMPDGWETNSTQYNSSVGWYGEKAPALRLSVDDSYLVVAYPDALINKLSLWCRSSVEGNKLRVEIGDGTAWEVLTTLEVPKTGTVFEVPVGREGMLRLVFERAGGYMVVDDVEAECNDIDRVPVNGYDGVSTGNKTSFTFENLESDATYGFQVVGVCGSDHSMPSVEYVVRLDELSGITDSEISAGEGPSEVYDLQGKRVPAGPLSRGIYIIKKGGQPARKVVVR